MPEAERRARMAGLRDQVKTHDVHRWARLFVAALRMEARRQARNHGADLARADSPSDVAAAVLADGGRPLLILLDYDGTLVGLRPSPEEASPDTEILRILATLALLPGVEVDVVSGRRRNDLEMWLGSLPVGLHAEHGLWSRGARDETWTRRDVNPAWLEKARAAMTARAGLVPGSFVEEKDASVVWHYRNVGAGTGRREAESLTRELRGALAESSATIMQGSRIVEVKDVSTDKGVIARELAATMPGARMLVIGDDVTDEDMFRSAPADAVTVHVGSGHTAAAMRLIGPDQVRVLLTALIEQLDLRIHPDHAVPLRSSESAEPIGGQALETAEATSRGSEAGS
jgi:trehalose 6-phosphate synthase/phosphatase